MSQIGKVAASYLGMGRISHIVVLGALILCSCGGRVASSDLVALVPAGEAGPMAAPAPNCAEAIFTKPCPPGATVSKCVSCSGIANCHGKETPVFADYDLSAEGLAASQGGRTLINKPANDVDGLCGAAGMPVPLRGRVIVDPVHPENSLLYQKVLTNFSECGSRMPFTATKPLSDVDQQCILEWIKKIPGVNPN